MFFDSCGELQSTSVLEKDEAAILVCSSQPQAGQVAIWDWHMLPAVDILDIPLHQSTNLQAGRGRRQWRVWTAH